MQSNTLTSGPETGKACDLGSKCYVSVSSKSAGAFGVLTKVGGK
jgi:hypothetical protein